VILCGPVGPRCVVSSGSAWSGWEGISQRLLERSRVLRSLESALGQPILSPNHSPLTSAQRFTPSELITATMMNELQRLPGYVQYLPLSCRCLGTSGIIDSSQKSTCSSSRSRTIDAEGLFLDSGPSSATHVANNNSHTCQGSLRPSLSGCNSSGAIHRYVLLTTRPSATLPGVGSSITTARPKSARRARHSGDRLNQTPFPQSVVPQRNP
jgi:hypothetical protein